MNANPRFVSIGMVLFLFSSAFLVVVESRPETPATSVAWEARAVFEEALTALGNEKNVTLNSGSAEAKAACADAVWAMELTHYHRAFEMAQEAIDRDLAFALAYWRCFRHQLLLRPPEARPRSGRSAAGSARRT